MTTAAEATRRAQDFLTTRLATLSPAAIALKGIRSTVPIGRYREGFIDDARFAQEMASLGYGAEETTRYLVSAKLDYSTTLTSELVTAYRDAYRAGRLSVAEYRLNLQQLGLRAGVVSTLVYQETTRIKLVPPSTEEQELRASGQGTVATRYREGLVDRAGFIQEMELLGYTAREIDRYAVLSDLAYDTNIRQETLSSLRSGVRTGRLTDQDFIYALEQLGVRQHLAQVYLQQEVMRRSVEAPTIEEQELRGSGSSIVISRYREGWTDLAQFRQEMELLGYTAREIDRYQVIAELTAEYDWLQDVLTYLREAYKKGDIDDQDFTSTLSTLGMSDQRIQVHLARAVLTRPKSA